MWCSAITHGRRAISRRGANAADNRILDPATVSVAAGVFRAYDIRGIVPKDLNAETVEVLGIAIAALARARDQDRIVVGRDGRHSSPQLAEALMRGLSRVGLEVTDIGMAPTPVLYFAARHLEIGNGVMVTGSHNDPEYNGLKIVLAGVSVLGHELRDVLARVQAGDYPRAGPGRRRRQDVQSAYVERIQRQQPAARPGARQRTVVVDAGGGMAGPIFVRLMEDLGHRVVPMNCEVDGDFSAHRADPSQPENMTDLAAEVCARKADIGFAFDGDGDRLGVVDSSGKIIWPDRQLMLLARDILARHPGGKVIHDVKCSRHLREVIEAAGGQAIMYKTGHSLIKQKMIDSGAVLAGEMSGHIFIKDRWYGFDDALYAGVRLMQIIDPITDSTETLFAALPESLATPELRMPLPERQHDDFMRAVGSRLDCSGARLITIDGLRVETENAWGLVRRSHTSPFIVLRFEADDDAALQAIQARFRSAVTAAAPQAKLPF